MSNILELIKNEKVEWKMLKDISEIGTGNYNRKDESTSGKYPFYVRSKNILKSNSYQFDEVAIIIPGEGGIGDIYHYVEGKYALHQRAYRIHVVDSNINTKFLYHYMLENFKQYILKKTVGSTSISIRKPMLENFIIPIPSIETQEKIVTILDKFTNYVTELQVELQAREKQYTYYRDKLLSEDYLDALSEDIDKFDDNAEIEWKTLGEIGVFTRGNGLQKKDFRDNGNPVIHYGQIYTKYGFSTEKTISFVDNDVFLKLRKAKPNDILMATTSENIEDVGKSVVWLGNEEIGFSGDMYSYSTSENSKYIAYFLQTNAFQKQKERKISGTKLIRIHSDAMEKFIIPLPPLYIQNKVVEILDKFQDFLSDTKGLLPEEIDQREKQYVYYREKLLTFDTDSVNTHTHTHTQLIPNSYFDLLQEAAKIVGVKLKKKVEWETLGSIAVEKLSYGSGASAKKYNGKIRYIRITDIDDKGNLKEEKVSPSEVDECYKLNYGDILFARSGATVGKKYIHRTKEQSIYAGYLIRLVVNRELALPEYVYHYLNTSSYDKFVQNTKSTASQPNINAKQYSLFEIPVPSLAVQENVVNILDKFETLVNDIKEGLPKEIELREKQYAYYREKLLDFSKSKQD